MFGRLIKITKIVHNKITENFIRKCCVLFKGVKLGKFYEKKSVIAPVILKMPNIVPMLVIEI